MKILNLRFKNLNSLYGEWSLDFTAPEYEGSGIFVLTGPTGAGKSTVLDAACLALYGRTPRLEKVNKSGNEIMSRRTGECFAEVTFESLQGIFRCHWSQHRARKSPDGKLADGKHEISDARTGEVLESKLSLTKKAVEERTGMDFDRFTRSMLLAQGGFDIFLRSDSDKRAPILEQITGTDIYSRISIEVHETLRRERQKLEILQKEMELLSPLEEEERRELVKSLDEITGHEKKVRESEEKINASIALLDRQRSLKEELQKISREWEGLEAEEQSFKADGQRLEGARRADEIEGAHASLVSLRNQRDRNKVDLLQEEETLSQNEKDLHIRRGALQKTREELGAIRATVEKELPLIGRIKDMDRKRAALGEKIDALNREGEALKKTCEAYGREADIRESRLKNLEEKENALALRQEETAGDEALLSSLDALGELADLSEYLRQEIGEKEKERESLNRLSAGEGKIRENLEGIITGLKREKEAKEKLILSLHSDLENLLEGRELNEIRREKEGLLRELTLLARVRDLEEERTRLADGKPCPLCGSLDHPFVRGNIPGSDETEQGIAALDTLLEKAQECESVVNREKALLTGLEKSLNEEEQRKNRLNLEEESREKERLRLAGEIESLSRRAEQKEKELREKLGPLGSAQGGGWTALMADLTERRDSRLALKGELETIRRDCDALRAEVIRFRDLEESQSRIYKEKRTLLEQGRAQEGDLALEREELYGTRDPLKEEESLTKQIKDREEREKAAHLAWETGRTGLEERKRNAARLKKGLAEREEELVRLEARFREEMTRLEFPGEEAFLAARMNRTERDGLVRQGEELSRRRIDLEGRSKDRRERLDQEEKQAASRGVSEESREELLKQREETALEIKRLGEESGSLKQRIEDDDRVRSGLDETFSRREKQQKECLRWERLHGLIGSADGKKFRNFAQGITFDLMISHANRQLVRMTDRYLLVRDNSRPLELNVIDNYQAGEVRSAKNLSGGEGFLISLALALGLSRMASRKVRVDTLFLDEGFGTLDEEALDMALTALSGLHQEGKLIGIISHIPALKERIPTRISVEPGSGGRSRLTGPGVNQGEQP